MDVLTEALEEQKAVFFAVMRNHFMTFPFYVWLYSNSIVPRVLDGNFQKTNPSISEFLQALQPC